MMLHLPVYVYSVSLFENPRLSALLVTNFLQEKQSIDGATVVALHWLIARGCA
jgi:hypothetical protein